MVTAAAEDEISCSTGVISAGDHPVKAPNPYPYPYSYPYPYP